MKRKKIIAGLCSLALILTINGPVLPIPACAAENGVLLSVDYESGVPELERFGTGGGIPEITVKTEANGNQYAEIRPNWASCGYSLQNEILNEDQEYRVHFDFASVDTRTDYTWMLADQSTCFDVADESHYHQFGLLSAGDGYGVYSDGDTYMKEFRINNEVLQGIDYEEGKWFTYDLLYNPGTRAYTLTISQRDNVSVSASISGSLKDNTYGWGIMPGRVYDALKLGYCGTIYMDNILVEKVLAPAVQTVTCLSNDTVQSAANSETDQIQIEFTDRMEFAALQRAVMLRDEAGTAVNAAGMLSADKKTYTLTLQEPLRSGKTYTLQVTTTACSEAGKNLSESYTKVFYITTMKTLLSIDYDANSPEMENFGGAEAEAVIREEKNGNKYLEVQPNWGSNGYSFATEIPADGGEYQVRFDFASIDTRTDYTWMLADKSTIDHTIETQYHQFGLLSAGDGNGVYSSGNTYMKEFRVNGQIIDGISYAEGKWFTYDMRFNRSTGSYTAVISQRDNPSVKGSVSGTLKNGVYGDGMFRNRVYDAFKVGYNGTVWLDNIYVGEFVEAPGIAAVCAWNKNTAQTAVNSDTTAIHLQFTEEMDEESLRQAVTLHNEIGETVAATGSLSEDKKTYILSFNAPLVGSGIYKLQVDVKAKSAAGGYLKEKYETQLFCEDANTLLAVNYDIQNPEIENFQGAAAVKEVKKEANGNQYMSIQPNWGNSGYSLGSVITRADREYVVRFDFALEGVRTDIASIMLCEKAQLQNGGDSVYHHFGLIRPTADGRFSVAGNDVSGIGYQENKWYSYEMTFNPSAGKVKGKISERGNPSVCGVYDFVAQAGTYGNGMPQLEYDALKFNCNGTIYIDNLAIYESIDVPVKCRVTSAKTGNIFDGQDSKVLQINLENILHTNAAVNLGYTITDEDGNTVDTASGIEFLMNPGTRQTYSAAVHTDKFGTYKIRIHMQVTGSETWEYYTEVYPFSVINKRKSTEQLNGETGGVVASYYVDTQEKWGAVKGIMLQAGIGAMRTDLRWSDVQTSSADGFSQSGAAYANVSYADAVSAGIKNMAIVSMENAPLYGGWDQPHTPHEIGTEQAWKEWEAYVDWISKTYKDCVTYWEVINEPNAFMTGKQYAEYLKRAYPILKKNDPDGLVCGFALSGVDYDWIAETLAITGPDYMDIITVHPYDWEWSGEFHGLDNWSTVLRDRNYVYTINRLKNLCASYGCGNIPILSTEMSISSTPPTAERKGLASLKAQAAELTQLYALTNKQGIIDSSYWYSLICTSVRGNSDIIEGDRNGNFGLVGNERDAVPYAAKPAYVAMAGYNKMLTGAEYMDGIENISTSKNAGMRAYRYQTADGKQVIVLWAENMAENVALALGTDSVAVYDKYTNKIGTMQADTGIYNFTATFEPIFIVGDFTQFKRQENTISVDEGRKESLCGDIMSFRFTDTQGRDLRIEAEGTAWARILENTGMNKGTGTVTVSTKMGARQEEPVDVRIYDGENLVYYGRLHIIVGGVYIEQLRVNGTEITSIADVKDGTAEISILADNLYRFASDAELIIAFYNQEGRLLKIQTQTVGSISRGQNTVRLQLAMPDACSAMKLLLWDSTSGAVPLCESVYI